ncbi:hypothetical protein H257_01846 [Aphanomyces astaci]|uniref:Uncharacterized protein n=1 Tax=Aphanomyces astaci TaxID=112090 RepID=W4H647_APHAT|nr:hypothetical protein H257_01846 [Aphanomyces astaci]ETV86759.1 hypothetical protein H257_01846 [Aphanomyces astaci]|eukprot:XP_009823558.1 hypothetical protein H257_01846 [Aphanomyces astaci]
MQPSPWHEKENEVLTESDNEAINDYKQQWEATPQALLLELAPSLRCSCTRQTNARGHADADDDDRGHGLSTEFDAQVPEESMDMWGPNHLFTFPAHGRCRTGAAAKGDDCTSY